MTTPTPTADQLGRPLNPDTGLPYPTASQAQLDLADELLNRLVGDLVVIRDEAQRDAVRDALVEAVVRQHGRTLRACLAELRDRADDHERDARNLVADLPTDGGTISGRIASADTLARAALTLRTLHLRGDRA